MKKIIFLFLFLQIYPTEIFSQNITREWVAKYNTPGSSILANDMALDSSGNIYVCGSGNNGITTIKYNPAGMKLWERVYVSGEPVAVQPIKMAVDKNSNIYIIGNTLEWFLVKYDSAGNFQWRSKFSGTGPGSSYPNDMVIDSIGNIYITGYSGGIGTSLDVTTVKYNPLGDTVWARRFDYDNYNDVGRKIILNKDNHIYVFGHILSLSPINRTNIVLLKYSLTGDLIFDKYITSPKEYIDYPEILTNDNEGNILIYIRRHTNKPPNTKSISYKYNTNGDSLWSYTFNGYGNGAYTSKILLDQHNNIYFIGGNYNSSNFSELFINKLYPTGEIEFQKNYYVNDNSIGCTDALINNENRILMTGEIIHSDGSMSVRKFLSLSSDLDANIKWNDIFNNNNNLRSNFWAIRILDFGNSFYSFGTGSGNIDSNFSLFLIKYNITTSITNQNQIIEDFSLKQNYPNPFNSQTKIKYNLPRRENKVEIKIYDIKGQVIMVMREYNKEAGSYEMNLDFSSQPSGVYYYSLIVNNESVSTKKMILLK